MGRFLFGSSLALGLSSIITVVLIVIADRFFPFICVRALLS
jgi:hypothetical protein